ncbi:MAG: hypothetical protein WKF75_06200 [Singulisphaera sp.]
MPAPATISSTRPAARSPISRSTAERPRHPVGPGLGNTFDITGFNSGTLNTDLSFSFVENLRGNTAADAFKFGASGVISGTVNGQGGTDTLDYSARTAAVSVNLLNGTATSTGGVSNIEDVAGGSGMTP